MDDSKKHDGKAVWTGTSDLIPEFAKEPERFFDAPSSRATPLGQVWCRCENPDHWWHEPRECGREVFHDGYCRTCDQVEHPDYDSEEET